MSRRGAEQKRKALHDEAQSAREKKTEAQSTNARETRGAEQVAARMLSETFAPGSELVNDIQNSNNKLESRSLASSSSLSLYY